MKINSINNSVLFLFLFLFFFSGTSFSSNKPNSRSTSGGNLSFTVRTVTDNGTYSPKHVLAIWIEKSGVFVKSRKVMAAARKQYLYSWIAASAQNSTDATTGATLSSHQTHTVTWNCKDLTGNIVPDGDYTIWVEFTDKHAQGPKTSFTFTKGANVVHLTPADETYFKDIVIDFTPMTAEFSANQSVACTSAPVTFTDNSTNATSWAWNFGANANPATASTQGPHQVSYSAPGVKTVSLTINGAVTETKTDLLTISATPVANFTYTANLQTVTFTNTSIDGTSWAWDFGDGNTATEQNPVHNFPATGGTFNVQLITSNGNCSDTSMIPVLVQTENIQDLVFNPGLSVNPIPGSSSIEVIMSKCNSIEIEISIFSVSGRRIYHNNFRNSSSSFRQQIDLKESNGIVFVEVNCAGQTYNRKISLK